MQYEKARQIAIDAGTKLKPYCEIIHIAGSIRRYSQSPHKRSADIKDIELICIPRCLENSIADLFGGLIITKSISENFVSSVKSLGRVVKGVPGGRYMQIDHRNIKIDLFMPDPLDFFRQYVIRTGSADYIKRTIAPAWNRLGWCGTDHGLRRISDCKEIISAGGKKVWEVVNKNGELPPVWSSEEDFFNWLKPAGIPFIAPRFRTI